jgi:hypothetical protein
MLQKAPRKRNAYRCGIEVNQNGKYCVRVRAAFGRHDWVLGVYFLASSFDRAMNKLEQSLQFLQQHEERLWFWCAERTDDPNLAGEMLSEVGLRLDRRAEFPRKSAAVAVPPDKPVPAFLFAPVQRALLPFQIVSQHSSRSSDETDPA